MSSMIKIIKFPTLENKEVCITVEDAIYIGLESMTVASILTGELKKEDYADTRFGGEAINLALKYCRKIGETKLCPSQRSESKFDANNNFDNHYSPESALEFETKCKEVDIKAWLDDFIDQITKDGLGMVHELLAVSNFLVAPRLTDLTCQCIFDYLSFKDYGEFRKAFAFQFLFSPYFKGVEARYVGNVLESILELPTLDEIHTEFKDKIPFTPDELKLAESENKLVRIGGNLEYKTNKRSIEELLIKVEYIVRRLSSFLSLSFWMDNTFSKCFTESRAYLNRFFNDQSNSDIRESRSTFREPVVTSNPDFMSYLLEGAVAEKIVNPCTSYENINVIEDDINNIELEMAADANVHKRKAEEITKRWYTKWQNDHPHRKDKVFPHLTYFLENRYQEIYLVLGTLRGWISSHEVQYNFNKLNIGKKTIFENANDQNEDQDEDAESEEQNEDHYEDEGSEEQNEDRYEDEGSEDLLSQESKADKQIRNDIVSSLTRLKYSAACIAGDFQNAHQFYLKLQIKMRQLLHNDLLLKDEEILTFICKEKFNLYMRASEQGTRSMISFAENKEEFDRIMKETDQKFGERGPVIEEAKKKYFLHYKKFHYAMVDETEWQIELNAKCEKGSLKRKQATSPRDFTNILNVHDD